MKKFIIISIIVVLVLAGIAGIGLAFGKGNGKGGTSVFNQGIIYPVKAHKIEKGSIASKVSASGKIEEVEKSEVYIETPLKINKLYVGLNDKVTKGQKLMELDTDELVSQLEKLKIDRNVQRLSLNSPSADAEIKRAESSENAALIALNDANEKLDNNRKLYEGNAISKSEMNTYIKAVEEAQRALDNAKLNYDSAISSKNMDRKVKEETLKATDLGISDLEKKIEKLNKSIICPIDGVIVESNVQVGSFTNSAMPAFKISNTSVLRVKAQVSEYNMKDVKVGQKVIITGEGIDKEANVTGKVDSISPIAKANATAGGEEVVVEVIVTIDKTAVVLKPGLSVTCDIFTNEKENVLVAPLNIVDGDKDGNKFVYVIDKQKNIMTRKPVKFGIASDMKAEILEGLNEGDLVVLDPQPTHKDGAKIKVLETK